MNLGIVSVWGQQGEGIVSKQYYDLLKSHFEVFVYVRGYHKSFELDSNYNLYVGSKRTEFKPKSINKRDFKRWIDTNKIEIVLFNEQQYWPPLLWCQEWGVKTIAYIDYYTEKSIPLYEAYDMLLCNTKRHLSAFSWHPNVHYLKWGTATNLFKPEKEGLVSEDGVVFFHSCGFSATRKGTDLLLKAFYDSDRKGKLIIHSQNDLLDSYPELKSTIDELVAEGVLKLIRKTVKAPGLYHLGDVYLYPTRLEGIGLSIMEAQSSGLFAVVPNEDPMKEFVLDHQSSLINIKRSYSRFDGYYWPQIEVSVNHLKEIINTLSERPQEVKQLKQASRAYALKELDFDLNMKSLPDLIKKLQKKEISQYVKDSIVNYELERPITHYRLVPLYNKYISKKLSIIKGLFRI